MHNGSTAFSTLAPGTPLGPFRVTVSAAANEGLQVVDLTTMKVHTVAWSKDHYKSIAWAEKSIKHARRAAMVLLLPVPFWPSSSYLMNKLNNTGLCDPDESSMPPGAPLPDADIKTINDWICAGALPD